MVASGGLAHIAECVGTCISLTDSYQRDVGERAATDGSERHVGTGAFGVVHVLDAHSETAQRKRWCRSGGEGRRRVTRAGAGPT